MRLPNGFRIDDAAFPLLQSGIAYWGVTSAAGNALGTTLVAADLDNHPTYVGNRIKVLTGGAWGQDRLISIHAAGGVITVDAAFTDSAGAVQQIAAGTLFVILSNPGGGAGGGGGMPPTAALWMFGIVSPAQVASLTVIDIPHLAGFQNDTFNNEFYMQILHAGGAAPEGNKRIIIDYDGGLGRFTTDAFSANVEAGDIVAIYHTAIEAVDIIARGTLDTSNATVPADSARTEGNDFFNGHLLVPTEGTYAGRATRIVDYTGVGGIFTVDPNNPFPGVTGLVDYIIIKGQAEFVPAADGANNRTPADVIGNKTDTIPAMNLAPGNDSIIRQVKAILERLGATPADPDDSVLANLGQRDDAATLDSLADILTTSIQAKLRRILARMSPDAFSATIQGVARTELDTMLAQLATYFVVAGASMALQVNGNLARTNLQQALTDFFAAFGCDGVNVFNPTIQGAARTDLDAALYNMATYFSALGAAWSVQINGNAARTNLEQVWEDFSAVFGADGVNVFNPTIQGAAQTNLDAALAQLAIYFAAAGAAMSVQVNGGVARANLELILEDYFAVVGIDGANVFNPTIQGAARLTFEAAWNAMATYISPAGAAYSAAVNPGGAARDNIEQTLEDLGDVLAGAGIITFPAAAPPANGISIAEVLREIYNLLAASDSSFQEQADTPVNITAILASETNVLNLAVAATRYIVRSLRLKCADPGANTVTVRLYELVNDVSTVVTTFTIDTSNYTNYFSLMDMFGLPHLAGDNLRVTVQASAGGPYAVTGQYSHATAT